MHGLIPSEEIEKEFKASKQDDEQFFRDCILLKKLGKKQMEEVMQIAVDSTERQAMIMAAYIANRLCEFDDNEREGMWYGNTHKTRERELTTLIYILSSKLPNNLFLYLEERCKEVFIRLKGMYTPAVTV